ncbi:response regulator [Chelativorans sp. ZYF759]|uniref:response regulator n=1 Tax=Chelativorans sp. ZYF759 TaxID=2692213 RepID=UPI00145D1EEC|nr:response regulator [Chelativorans sp. ZYF759]NMG39561.1 response regulator [Chelativorans sp. ZYF759]
MSERDEQLADLNVLVVEDEALVALNLEDMLADLGCRVVGPVMRLAKAVEFFESSPLPDIAILDVNLGGEPVFGLAERISSKRVPIVFATGYGKAGLPQEWHRWPILQKPYTMDDVASSMKSALGLGAEAS